MAASTLAPRRAAPAQWDSAVTSLYLLGGAAGLLLAIGLVMVLSSSSIDSLSATGGASPYTIFINQAGFALIGLPLAWVASRMPARFYTTIAWPALGVAMGLQLLVFVPGLGHSVGGNTNWLDLGVLTFQPSELVKLTLAVWLGAVLSRKRALLDQWKHVVVPAVVVAVVAIGLVLAGHDLGTALVMLLLVAGALFVAGVPLRMFVVGAAVAVPLVWVLTQASPSRVRRITAFFSDDCDISDACYQTNRGLSALASGGWSGQGLGESREKWAYLPERTNDFIFAILGEELGLLGTVLVLALFGVLAVAMTRVVRRHPDPFVQVTTAGIASWVLGQAMVNIAVVLGLLPVIGVPLPLVSAGGSALITTMLALGVVLSFARTEPGAAEALAARPGAVRRSLAVVGRSARAWRGGRG